MVVSHCVLRRRFHVFVAAAALVAANAFAPSSTCRAEEDFYSADLQLAPLAFDGRFPVAIPAQSLSGNLVIDTDVRGKLRGTLTVNDLALSIGGTASHADGKLHVVFTASTSGAKIKFIGDVPDGSTLMTGTATGKGFLAAGKNSFTIDLSTAGPETATVEYQVTQNAKGKLKGRGRVLCCGEEVALAATGKVTATAITLGLKQGKNFSFKGTGVPPVGGGDATLDWSAKGFGASAVGTGLVFVVAAPAETVSYPSVPTEFETDREIAPIVPSSGTAPRGKFTIAPALPAGLVIDAATGTITGTPTEVRANRTYTVTAANFSASSTATFSFATRLQRQRSLAKETRFLSDLDIKHFLRRAEFGPRQLGGGQTSLDRVKQIGLDAYVDNMLLFATNGPAEAIAAPELINANDPPTLRGKFPSAVQIGRWWSSLMMNSDNPFQERLAFFWADRFAVSAGDLTPSQAHFMQEYINLYRYGGNGNLKPLLLQMARSGAMLKFLNGDTNTAANINENFAREFWELFTLGVDVDYTQADIVQGARAFTGYKFVTDPVTGLTSTQFDPALHDSGGKTVLGQVIVGQSATDDYDAMVQITLDHGHAAEFICTCLFQEFAFENPHPSLVADMTTLLKTSNYDLAPVIKAILKSEAFFSDRARAALVKHPVDYAMGFVHSTGLKITPAALQTQLSTMGQNPGSPPGVNGFPVGTLWFSAQNMADRANFLDTAVNDTARQATVGINVATILPPVGQRQSGQVVDAVASLLDVALVAAERQLLVDFLEKPTPFDGSSQAQLDDRVRGLLYIMAQHPQYELR
jgi:uncharacterized protein (DUF1800 family)